jgi:hypothetical protein
MRVGDCVRVTTRSRHPLYSAGDKSTVLRGPHVLYTDGLDFYVSMDKAGSSVTGDLFLAHEIEPDV